METIGRMFFQTFPVWLYFFALATLFIVNGIVEMDWTGVDLISWIGATSGILGACIAVVGAYLIARFQIKPVLAQHRSAQKREHIERSREAALISREIYQSIQDIVEFSRTCNFITSDRDKVVFTLLNGDRDEINGQAKNLNHLLLSASFDVRMLTIYPDTLENVVFWRSTFLEYLNKLSENLDKIIDHYNPENSITDVAAPTRSALGVFVRLRKLSESCTHLIGALQDEQERLEKLIISS